jgi:hypothetical protein
MGNVAESAAVAYSGTRDEESRAHVRCAQRTVLECDDCGERLVLLGSVTVRKAGRVVVECDCGEEFTLAGHLSVSEPDVVANGYWEVRGHEEKRRYSWVDDCLKWLEGKEAREEYYMRLEQAA